MKTLHTSDTNDKIYLDALTIRKAVFVTEQQVPESIEIDENEGNTIHFVLYFQDNQPVATVRLLPINQQLVKIQRMAVLNNARNQGIGSVLMTAAEAYAKEHGYLEIQLGAQESAISFYEKMNYHPYGNPFKEANIQHVHMKKVL